MTLRLTNSEMQLFRRCPRQWYLGSYRRLKPRSGYAAGTSISIGNLYHDALAFYYTDTAKNDPVKFVDAALAQGIEESPEFEDNIVKEADLVRIMVAGYLEWLADTGADADLKIEGAERMVEVPLASGITLLSKLDAPVERISDGAKLAIEHKTVGSLDQPLALAKLNTQFLTEHLVRFLAERAAGATDDEAYERCTGVLLNMARKVKRTATAKPPFYGREDVPHNIHELRNHWVHCASVGRQIIEATRRLNAGESHHVVCPPNPTHDDKWDNSFYKIFVMLDDGSDYEGAIEAIYEVHDPLERYEGAEQLVAEAQAAL